MVGVVGEGVEERICAQWVENKEGERDKVGDGVWRGEWDKYGRIARRENRQSGRNTPVSCHHAVDTQVEYEVLFF